MIEKFQIEIYEKPSGYDIKLVSTKLVHGIQIPNGTIDIGEFGKAKKEKIEAFVSVLTAAFWHLGLDLTNTNEFLKDDTNGS
jgi:hypothetical protein